jgi:hypothetical protein
MSALTVAALRARIESAVDAAAGFTKSRFSPAAFAQDVRQLAHGAFSVGAPQTDPHRAEVRQIRAAGAMVNTIIEVKFSANHRADNQVSDYDTGLALEALMIKAVVGASLAGLHVVYVDSVRDTTPDAEFWLSTSRFRCIHRIDLE